MKKLIKKILYEVVGVPKGIEMLGRQMYDNIIQYLEQNPEFLTNEQTFEVYGNHKYGFSDYDIDSVNFKIGQYQANNFGDINEYSILGLGVTQGVTRYGKMVKTDSKNILIEIKVVRPYAVYPNDDINPNEVMTLLKSNKSNIISSLVHELKHSYDGFKSPKGEKIEDLAVYKTVMSNGFGDDVVDRFLWNTYYSSKIESSVRPSEIFSLAIEKGITKNNFRKFLDETNVYQNLKNIVDESYENFRDKLMKNMVFIDQVLKSIDSKKPNSIVIPNDDEGKIDLFLKILYISLSNSKIKNFKEQLSDSFLIPFFHNFGQLPMSAEDEKLFRGFIKKTFSFKNRETEYFKYMIKENQYQAYQAIRKLVKVYSLLPDDIETGKVYENTRKIERFDPTNFEMSQLIKKIIISETSKPTNL